MSDSHCAEVAPYLLDAARRRLPADVAEDVKQHLSNCVECQKRVEAERELDAALGRLPQHAASEAFRERILALATDSNRVSRRQSSASRRRVLGGAAAALVGVALVLGAGAALRSFSAPNPISSEAVNDHLRLLYAQRPVEIESGGIHQVKPWFAGKLDFSPVLGFEGDSEFSLEGGAVAYFVDRKAASFVFKHRLHVITLFVFRAEGLPWRAGNNVELGAVPARQEAIRGFNTLAWRRADLGYALVSDVNAAKLLELGRKITSSE